MNGVAGGYTVRREGRQLLLTGVLNATPEEVYEAWVRPDQLAKWWVCDAGLPLWCGVEAKPGGRLTAVGQEGTEAWVFLEVVRNRRLVITDVFEEAWVPSDRPGVVCTVSMAELGGRTSYRLETAGWAESDRLPELQGRAFERLAALVEEG